MGLILLFVIVGMILFINFKILIANIDKEKELQQKEEELDKRYREWLLNRFNRRR